MPRFLVNPQSGRLEDTSDLEVNIDGLQTDSKYRIRFENASLGKPIRVKNSPGGYLYVEDDSSAKGTIELNLPEHWSESFVSIFATIEKEQRPNKWVPENILASSYSIVEDQESPFDGTISVYPNFISTNDNAKIEVDYKPKDKIHLSINNRHYIIRTDDSGHGSHVVRSHDLNSEKGAKSIKRYPVKFFDEKSNSFKNTGSFVNFLPDAIATRVSESDNVTISDYQLDNPTANIPSVSRTLPSIPKIDLSNCSVAGDSGVLSLGDDFCSLVGYDSAPLPNGQSLIAVLRNETIEEGIMNNNIRVEGVSGISSEALLDAGQVSIKIVDGEVIIYVNRSSFDKASIGDKIGFEVDGEVYELEILDKNAPTEYTSFYSFTVEKSNFSIELGQYCVQAYIIKTGSTASTTLSGTTEYRILPSITTTDEDGEETTLPIISFSIATPPRYLFDTTVSYAYIIAEALVNQQSQLYFYSFEINTGGSGFSSGPNPSNTFGWQQITFSDSNRNPQAHCDKLGTLHVVWEGDRDQITQIFYSSLGPGSYSSLNSAIVSQFDAESDFNSSENSNSFDKLNDSLFLGIGRSEQVEINRICNENDEIDEYLANTMWSAWESELGNVSIFDNSTIDITANASENQAMAFMKLDRELDGTLFTNNFRQRSFGLSFNLESSNTERLLDNLDIQQEWDVWKSQFTSSKNEEFSNLPIYETNGNRLLLNKKTEVYDRFFPIAGSYKNSSLIDNFNDCEDQVNSNFVVEVSGENSTLRHFMIGLMPEKVKFTATNIESLEEYQSRLGLSLDEAQATYISSSRQILYTGYYKMFVVMNVLNNYFGSVHDENISISRNIGDKFNLNTPQSFDIVSHYVKMFDKDSESWNGIIYDDSDSPSRYLFSLFVARNEQVVFGESGMVDFSDGYETFDIGIGVPSSGQFVSQTFEPYESMTYEDKLVELAYTEINIGQPNYVLNDKLVNIDDSLRITNSMSASIEKDVSEIYKFDEMYSWLNLGLSENVFPYIVLTRNGYNKNPKISEGKIGTDIHLVWQSNRDRYWDIYYSSSLDRGLPYRHDTQISKTSSNSISPDISIDRNGNRLVVWQDDRDGHFQIYSAKSLLSQEFSSQSISSNQPSELSESGFSQTRTERRTSSSSGSFLDDCIVSSVEQVEQLEDGEDSVNRYCYSEYVISLDPCQLYVPNQYVKAEPCECNTENAETLYMLTSMQLEDAPCSCSEMINETEIEEPGSSLFFIVSVRYLLSGVGLVNHDTRVNVTGFSSSFGATEGSECGFVGEDYLIEHPEIKIDDEVVATLSNPKAVLRSDLSESPCGFVFSIVLNTVQYGSHLLEAVKFTGRYFLSASYLDGEYKSLPLSKNGLNVINENPRVEATLNVRPYLGNPTHDFGT